MQESTSVATGLLADTRALEMRIEAFGEDFDVGMAVHACGK